MTRRPGASISSVTAPSARFEVPTLPEGLILSPSIGHSSP
jgi:hypothetical protein